MERGRILIVGADEAEPSITPALRSAGYGVLVLPQVPREMDPPPEIIFALGARAPHLCRGARSAYPLAQVIACVARDDDPLAGECLAAGADDILPPTDGRVPLLSRVRAGLAHVKLRRRLEHERRLFELIDELTTTLADADVVEGLFEVATRLAEMLGFTRCAVLVLPGGDDPNTLYLVAASDDQGLSRMPIDLRKYPEIRLALESREPVFVDDPANNPILGEHGDAAARHGGRTLVAVPLTAGGRTMGALQLRSAEGRPALDRQEVKLLRLISRLLSISLRDGRIQTLREQTRRVAMTQLQERRLRAIEQYRDFFESANDGVVVVDAEGQVLYVNRAAEQMTGYARSGLAGRTLHEIVDASQRAGLGDVLHQAVAGTHLANFDLQINTTSGEPLRVSVSTSLVLAAHSATVLFFRDVTVARALEEELRKTKEFLERLIDSTVDAIVAADIGGKLIIFNQGAERLYGWSAEEVLGQISLSRLYPDGEADRIMAELRSGEHGGVGRLLPSRRDIITRDGTRVPVTLTASILYEEGQEIATVGVLSDLRERLNMEQQLAQAQEKLAITEKQALIADLAGTTAHELNQPLTSVMGYAELLKKRMSTEDSNLRAVDIILREAERMAAIVKKIGKITRYETKPYVGSTTMLDLDKSANES